MDLFEIIKMLRRRWYVIVPISAVTLAFALYVHMNTPPEYQATGFLQLETPELDRAQDPISATIDPVALSENIGAQGDVSFSVSPLEGQYFTITAASGEAPAAVAAVDQIINDLSAQVAELQDDEGIPAEERVELRMAVPEVAVETRPDATQIATARMFLYNASAVGPENPYGPDASTGRLLQVAAMSDAGQQQFDQLAGEDIEFEVDLDARDAAALLEVLTTGPDPVAVVDAFHDVRSIMAEDLAARQDRADVPESQRITIEALAGPLEATDESPPVSRAAVGILALGGLLALGVAAGVENLDNTPSRARREDEDAKGPHPTANPAGVGPETSPAKDLAAAADQVGDQAALGQADDVADPGARGVAERADAVAPDADSHDTKVQDREGAHLTLDGQQVAASGTDGAASAADRQAVPDATGSDQQVDEAVAATSRARDDE